MKKTITIFALLSSVLSIAQIPQNELMFYFPFSGNAIDAGPNNVNATIVDTNGVYLDDDKNNSPNSSYFFGGSYMFLGNSDPNVNIGDTSFTFSAWFKTGTPLISLGTIYANNFGWSNGFAVGMNYISENNIWVTVDGGGIPNSATVTTPNDTTINIGWHNVVLMVDRVANLLKIYIDGVQSPIQLYTQYGTPGGTIVGNDLDITGLPINTNTPTNNSCIGAYKAINNSVYNPFYGNLDEVILYRRALSPTEISNLYNGANGIFETFENKLVSVYPNPTSSKININLKTNNAKLKIYNINGQEVYQCIMKSNEQTLDVSGLVKGIYFLEITDGEQLLKSRFIKE